MKYRTDIEGYMSEKELDQIAIWANDVPSGGVIIEFGSYYGRSSVCWAMNCDPSVTIYCIDKFVLEEKEFYDDFLKNVSSFKNVIPIKGRSPWDITYNGPPVDLFFMDASHTNPNFTRNFMFYNKFVKDGGVLCGHDYCDEWPEVMSSVNHFADILNKKVKLYKGTTLWELVD